MLIAWAEARLALCFLKPSASRIQSGTCERFRGKIFSNGYTPMGDFARFFESLSGFRPPSLNHQDLFPQRQRFGKISQHK
jgi:hypothetical protein